MNERLKVADRSLSTYELFRAAVPRCRTLIPSEGKQAAFDGKRAIEMRSAVTQTSLIR